MKSDLIKEWLSSEGYRYDVDNDGDIHFKYQGIHMFFTVDSRDEIYFRLIVPNIYQENGDHAKVLEACNTICQEMKVVKAYVIRGSLWLAIEMFIDSSPEIGDFFERCCMLLHAAFQRAGEMIL